MRFTSAVVPVLIIALLLSVSFVPSSDAGDASTSVYKGDFLFDRGNGDTIWMEIKSGSTYSETAVLTITNYGIPCSFAGGQLTVDGKTTTTIGATTSGGDLSTPGTTGITVDNSWNFYSWNPLTKDWAPADPSDPYTEGPLAVGFYPAGVKPVETPIEKSSWTMIYADAENSGNQTAEYVEDAATKWSHEGDETAFGCYSGALYARGHVIVKYGMSNPGMTKGSVSSYNAETGEKDWSFAYPKNMIEMSCALIMGKYIYIQSSDGMLYRFEYEKGPGNNNEFVTTFNGLPYGSSVEKIPYETPATLIDKPTYGEGPYTMVGDSGAIYLKSSNGMVYCFDMNLSLVWSYQMEGGCYVSAVSVTDQYVGAGAYDGCLYILDKTDGSLIDKETVYFEDGHGTVNTPIMIRDGPNYKVFVSYSDGLIMNSKLSSLAIYDFDGADLVLVKDLENKLGKVTTYITKYESDTFNGALVSSQKGIFKVDGEGNYSYITDIMKGGMAPHSAPTVLNNKYIYSSTYGMYKVYCFDIEGNILGEFAEPIQEYSMAGIAIADGIILHCNDQGVTCVTTTLPVYVDPTTEPEETPLWKIMLAIILIIVIIIAIIWAILRYALKWEKPFHDLKHHIYTYFYGENYTHNTKSKRRLYAIILLGALLLAGASLLSLCVGNKTNMGLGEALSGLISSLRKGGVGLTSNEYLIYVDRMPRIIAAIGVGIGLSVAGAMYQAVIKNPLVEPYIMGVSSGSGTLVIAAIAFGFTFFGLFPLNSPYLIAICAIVGGLLAFSITMFLAIKTGGKSINYVLAGIVIGLVFSAIQSLMIIKAGHSITNALSWLYGSFTGITWEEAWLVLVPALALSFVPIIWAKEFNLILLGDDQAKQMGLNAELFDRIVLITASVLTAFCVAFCGIIGFVGLIIPHLSRMIMGGDHRLMLPVSIVLGGTLMIIADLLSRVLVPGFELPVGAVTTMIGIPVFAYILITRGRGYDE